MKNKEIRKNIQDIKQILEEHPEMYDTLTPFQKKVVGLIKDLDKAEKGKGKGSRPSPSPS